MSCYTDWGFTRNIFEQTPLGADRTGETLLVGRDKELALLTGQITNPPRLPTIEGLNGVGKTSLANVAAYKMFERFLRDRKGALYIPCRTIFQLTPETNVAEFTDTVFIEIAQTLIERLSFIEQQGFSLRDARAIDRWLNAPYAKSVQGGLAAFGFGGSLGGGTSAGGKGFEKSGFRKSIREWLADMFPDRTDGGIVCVIDNLELLQASQTARETLERLRDELLTIPGLRCVLCGANGIIFGVASSPRLNGILHAPIELGGVAEDAVRQVLDSRMRTYTHNFAKSYLPITLNGFERLYKLLNSNLRSVLSEADEYCMWVSQRTRPESNEDKERMLEEYILDQGGRIYTAVEKQVSPRGWRVFEDAIRFGGSFSPSDFERFGFKSMEAFRPYVKELEDVHLLTSIREESDKRRKSGVVVAKGYLVSHFRNA